MARIFLTAVMLAGVAAMLQPSNASAQEKLRMRIQAAVPSGAMYETALSTWPSW